MYILIHSWICRRISDKKIFTRPISGNKTTFFGLNRKSFKKIIKAKRRKAEYLFVKKVFNYDLTIFQKDWNITAVVAGHERLYSQSSVKISATKHILMLPIKYSSCFNFNFKIRLALVKETAAFPWVQVRRYKRHGENEEKNSSYKSCCQ